jgi:phosphoribosylanthranilate isomerase
MTWVKICGLTDATDVRAAVEAGADAIGFVNIQQSPRFVTVEKVRELVAGIDIPTVLLTIDVAPKDAVPTLDRAGTTGIQPYGHHARETARIAAAAGYLTLFPQDAAQALNLADVPGIPLIDAPTEGRLGGTGLTFDWSVVAGIEHQFVLAGGLGPDNVRAAVGRIRPWGVDASSRLERTPGRKDHGMVADFISKAKST